MAGSESDFWGSARDIGLIAVGIVSFAGAVYTYSYGHVLGIDFSLADTSAVALLIAASRVFYAYSLWILGAAVGLVGVAALLAVYPPADSVAARFEGLARFRIAQIIAVLGAGFVACLLAYKTANDEVANLKSGHANPAKITFVSGTEGSYPRPLIDANDKGGILVALDTASNLYVFLQQQTDPSVGIRPDAQVFSVRKSDIVSVETRVP